jgi:hypothetical protein
MTMSLLFRELKHDFEQCNVMHAHDMWFQVLAASKTTCFIHLLKMEMLGSLRG